VFVGASIRSIFRFSSTMSVALEFGRLLVLQCIHSRHAYVFRRNALQTTSSKSHDAAQYETATNYANSISMSEMGEHII
jgi:hypothetical protein